MLNVSVKLDGKVIWWLTSLFQPTFRCSQNQQLRSFIESTLQSDGSIITQVSADVLVTNKTDQQLHLITANLESPKLGNIDTCIFMPAYIPANKTLSVRVVILSRDNLKKKSIDCKTACKTDQV